MLLLQGIKLNTHFGETGAEVRDELVLVAHHPAQALHAFFTCFYDVRVGCYGAVCVGEFGTAHGEALPELHAAGGEVQVVGFEGGEKGGLVGFEGVLV
jgi:hypothetical protein